MNSAAVIGHQKIGELRRVLNNHCQEHGVCSKEGRESVAASLIAHYQAGTTDAEMLARLIEKEDRPCEATLRHGSR